MSWNRDKTFGSVEYCAITLPVTYHRLKLVGIRLQIEVRDWAGLPVQYNEVIVPVPKHSRNLFVSSCPASANSFGLAASSVFLPESHITVAISDFCHV